MHEEISGNGVALWRFNRLSQEPALTHFVSGRLGGVSPAPYDSLNLGLRTADDSANVHRNRERLFAAAGVRREHVGSCSQVHGDEVVVVDSGTLHPPQGDALATNTAGVMLFLLMADCVPVLVYDPVRRAAGLAHAGWRGTVLGVSGRLVRRMVDAFGCAPHGMLAAIGPSIGPCCYEVGEDVIERVRGSLPQAEALLEMHTSGHKAQFNLWLANRAQLATAGIPEDHIEASGICTKCHAIDFFSDRKARPGGRFGAGIMLVPAAQDPRQAQVTV